MALIDTFSAGGDNDMTACLARDIYDRQALISLSTVGKTEKQADKQQARDVFFLYDSYPS
jgi:hypothetical protein